MSSTTPPESSTADDPAADPARKVGRELEAVFETIARSIAGKAKQFLPVTDYVIEREFAIATLETSVRKIAEKASEWEGDR